MIAQHNPHLGMTSGILLRSVFLHDIRIRAMKELSQLGKRIGSLIAKKLEERLKTGHPPYPRKAGSLRLGQKSMEVLVYQ